MSSWEFVSLSKLGNLKTGKYIPHGKDLVDFVSEKLVKGCLYVDCLTKALDQNRIKGKKFPINTICIKLSYRIGRVYSSILKKPAYLFHTMAGLETFQDIANPLFIKYCFDWSVIQEKWKKTIVEKRKNNDTLSKDFLLSVLFPKPPLDIQEKIGRIIQDYDLFLENLKKQLNLLEKIKDQQVFFHDFEKFIQMKIENLMEEQKILESIKKELIEEIYGRNIEIK